MDDRPNVSIWGTINSCIEIALQVYELRLENGKSALMVEKEIANKVLSEKTKSLAKEDKENLYFGEGLPVTATLHDLIKNEHLTDPKALEVFGTADEIYEKGKILYPYFFGEIDKPNRSPWGDLKEQTPIDNGIFLVSSGDKDALAVHKSIVIHAMSDYPGHVKDQDVDDFYFYDLYGNAAIALFDLSFHSSKVLDSIVNMDSLVSTINNNFPDYVDYCSDEIGFEDMGDSSYMFLQKHIDDATEKSAYPLEKSAYPLERGAYPLEESSSPLEESSSPLEKNIYPVENLEMEKSEDELFFTPSNPFEEVDMDDIFLEDYEEPEP